MKDLAYIMSAGLKPKKGDKVWRKLWKPEFAFGFVMIFRFTSKPAVQFVSKAMFDLMEKDQFALLDHASL